MPFGSAINHLSWLAVLTCPTLTLVKGTVSYSRSELTEGTVANHLCNQGNSLSGSVSRTCVAVTGSNELMWSGSQSFCVGEYV